MASRNMIFRMGVDASDFKTKMEQAGVTAERTGKRIKDSFSGAGLSDEVSRIMGWGSSSTGVRAITADNVALAQDQLQSLRSYRDMLAGAGFDDYQFGEVSERIRELEYDLNAYTESLRDAAAAESDAAGNAEGLGQAASRTSRSFRDMGSSGNLMERVSNQIGRIRSSADRSDLSVGKLLRSIRNISIADFGFRLVRSVFGELRSITSSYISQNETLQAQVDGLNTSMGQALAPAINVVTNAMSYLMPYVVGVSNAFGELMANLFGSGWSATASDANKTASAVNGAAAAQERMNLQLMSFDQINKLSGTASGSTSGTDIGTTTTPIEGKTPAWMERFKASFEELFGSEEFQSANLGGKIGQVLQAGLDWLGDEGKEFDWRGVGTKLRENLDSFMDAGWGQSLFSTAGIYVAGFADAIIGFLAPEWEELRQHYEEKGALGAGEYITGFILGIPGAVADLVFSDMIAPFFSGMEEFYREKGNESAAKFVGGIGDGFETYGDLIREYFDDHIVSTIVNLLGLDAPYPLFKSFGVMTSEDFAKGINEGSGSVETELQAMAKTCDETAQTMRDAFSFNWKLPHLKVPHIGVEWDPVDNVLAQFFGVTAFPRLSVSWFAKGGILDGAQIFGRMGSTLLGGGEAGREAILPLDSNTGWMDVLADRISSTLSSQGGDVHATINLIVDGDVVTTKVIRNLRQRSRSGAPVF